MALRAGVFSQKNENDYDLLQEMIRLERSGRPIGERAGPMASRSELTPPASGIEVPGVPPGAGDKYNWGDGMGLGGGYGTLGGGPAGGIDDDPILRQLLEEQARRGMAEQAANGGGPLGNPRGIGTGPGAGAAADDYFGGGFGGPPGAGQPFGRAPGGTPAPGQGARPGFPIGFDMEKIGAGGPSPYSFPIGFDMEKIGRSVQGGGPPQGITVGQPVSVSRPDALGAAGSAGSGFGPDPRERQGGGQGEFFGRGGPADMQRGQPPGFRDRFAQGLDRFGKAKYLADLFGGIFG